MWKLRAVAHGAWKLRALARGVTARGLAGLMGLWAALGVTAASHAQGNEILTFAAAQVSIRETDESFVLALRAAEPLVDTLIFGVEVVPQSTAQRGQITPLQSQITLFAGEQSAMLSFVVTDDAILSGDQGYQIQLYPISTGANPGVLSQGPVLVRLIDDEAFSPARLMDASLNEGAGEIAITVRLDRPAEVAASAEIQIFGDTARAGSDFEAEAQTVMIDVGMQAATARFALIDDTLFENEERLIARIIGSTSLEIVDFDAEITLIDNDTPPTLQVSAMEVQEGTGHGNLLVTLDAPAGVETRVDFDFSSGTALIGTDFGGQSGTLIFPEGVHQLTVPFTLVDDQRDEPNEDFALTFTNPQGLRLDQDVAHITLIDDDPAPRLITDIPALREGEPAQISLRLDAPSDREVSVQVELQAQTAQIPADIARLSGRLTFAPGETGPVLVDLLARSDAIFEEEETVLLSFTDPQNLHVDQERATMRIVDSNAVPTLSFEQADLAEGDGDAVLRFVLSEPSSRVSSFALTSASGTAISGADFTPLDDDFSIPAGQTLIEIPFRTLNDRQHEANETLSLELHAAAGLEFAQASYDLAIIDDDPEPELTLIAAASVDEGAAAELIFNLAEASGRDVRFSLTIAGTSADPGRDLARFDGAITIPAGQRTASLSLQTIDDILYEPAEALRPQITQIQGARYGGTPTAIAIRDNDTPPTVSLIVPPLTEGEPGRAYVRLSKLAGVDTVIDLGIFEGSARQDFDYAVPQRSLVIPKGASSIPLPLQVLDDEVFEGEETFEIALLNALNATITDNLATVTIADDDDFPTATVSAAPLAEGNPEQSLIEFTLSTASQSPVSVAFEVENGSAVFGQDFLTSDGIIEFAPGQTRQTLDMQIIDDRTFEGPQTFTLRLTSGQGTALTTGLQDSNQQAADGADGPVSDSQVITLSIADNDPLPRLLVAEINVLEADAETATVLPLSLDRRAEKPVAFAYALADVPAENLDVRLPAGVVTFAPGEVQKTIEIWPLQDTVDEDTEIFHLLFSQAQNIRLPETAARIFILDDDPAPFAAIADTAGIEGQAAQATAQATAQAGEARVGVLAFPISLSAASGREVTLQFETAPDPTSLFPADPTADIIPVAGTLTFAPGETQKMVEVQITDDRLDELDETVQLRLSGGSNVTLNDVSAIGTIGDDDAAPLVRADSLSVSESNTDGAMVRVSLSHPSGQDIWVDYALIAQTAELGSDIRPARGTLRFPAGSQTASFGISLIDDSLDEDVEYLTIALSNPSGARLDTAQARLTITDNDLGPELRVFVPQFSEAEVGGLAALTLQLMEAAAQPLTLDWQTTAGTATANEDFIPAMGTVTFAPGQRELLLPIDLLEDSIDEGDETIELLLSSSQIRVDNPTLSLSIIDNDPAPALAIIQTRLSEAETLSALTLRLSAPAERDLSGRLAAGSATAILGTDFDLPQQTFTIPAGVQEISVPIALIDDLTDENEERFDLSAALITPEAEIETLATLFIDDNDPEPELRLLPLTIEEGAQNAAMSVEVSEPSGKAITLTYETRSGSAVEGLEFAPTQASVTLPPLTKSASLPLSLIDDSFDEIDENFTVALVRAARASLGTPTAPVTLLDNDPAVRVTLLAAAAQEDGQITAIARLAEPSGQPVELEIETVSGVAIADQDYVARQGRLLIEPGALEARFEVNLIDDMIEEPAETFGLRIRGARNAQFDPLPVVMTIEDDDVVTQLSVEAQNMTEALSANARLVFSLSSQSDDVIVIEYAVNDGTALNDQDFSLSPGALIFLPGEQTKTLPVPLLRDESDEFDETFLLSLIASSIELETDQIPITIADSDPAPTLQVRVQDTDEAAGTLSIDLLLSAPSQKPISGLLDLAHTSATFAASFAAQTLAFDFAPGQRIRRLTLPLTDDVFDEFDEEASLTLREVLNADVPEPALAFTIADDDAPAVLQVTARDFSEADAGDTHINITLDRPSGMPVSFDYAYADASASQGSDWQGAAGTITLAPGEAAAALPLTILNDDIYEGDESLVLQLGNLTNITANAPQHTFTVREDELLPRLSANVATVDEGARGSLALTLDTPLDRALDVAILMTDGSGNVGRDLEPLVQSVRFAAGQTQAAVDVLPIDDPFDEPDETFALAFAAETIVLPDAPLTLTIADNDAAPTLVFEDLQLNEINGGALRFSLSLPSNKPIAFTLVPESGSATPGADYQFVETAIMLPPGQTQVTVPITLVPDGLNEAPEDWLIAIVEAENLTLDKTQARITIEDLDPLPLISFSDLIIDEAASSQQRTLQLRLDVPSGRELAFTLSTQDASALSGQDFVPLAQTVTFAPGETQQDVVLELIDDRLFESPETFIVTLGALEYVSAERQQALISILDDDPEPQLVYSAQTLQEAEGFSIPIALDAPAGRALTYGVQIEDAAAVQDLRLDAQTITFAPGQTQGVVSGQVLADLRDEDDQEILLTLLNAGGTPAGPPLALLIEDQDPAPNLRLSAAPVVEGEDEQLMVRFVLDQASEKQVSVALASQDASAVAGLDYVAMAGRLTFAPLETELEVPLALLDDTVFELAENFSLQLSDPQNVTLVDSSVLITIDNDDPQPNITIALADLAEGRSQEVTANLDRASSQTVIFDYALTDGTARQGQDFAPQGGSVLIEAGATTARFMLTALLDEIDEANETANLTLFNVSNAVTQAANIPVTIIDGNDAPTFTLTPAPVLESAGEGGVTVTLGLSHPSASPLTFTYETRSGTARAGLDFVPASGRLVLEPGQTTGTIRLDLINDPIFEGPESFTLTVAPAIPGQDSQTLALNLTDDEPAPTLRVDTRSLAEGDGQVALFVSLDRPAARDLAYAFSAQAPTAEQAQSAGASPAEAGTDFQPLSGELMFAAGLVSELLFLEVIEDARREDLEALALIFTPQAQGAPFTAILTIADNDPLPILSIANTQISEDGDAQAQAIDLQLNTASDQTITLTYRSVFDGEASVGDMVPLNGTVTLTPGQTSARIPVAILADQEAEGDEAFTLQFITAQNVRLTSDQVQITLRETLQPSLSLDSPETREGQDMAFTLSLTPTSPRPFYFDYQRVDEAGAAVGPRNFQLIDPGQTSITLNIPTQDNAVDEPDMPLRLAVSQTPDSPLKLTNPRIVGTGLILDDDPDPILNIQASRLREGEAGFLELSLTGLTTKQDRLNIAIGTGGTAQPNVDLAQLDTAITLADLATPKRLPLRLIDDDLNEALETFEVQVDNPGLEVRAETDTFIIADNDPLPQLRVGNLTVAEGDTTAPYLELSAPSGRDLAIRLRAIGQSAQAGLDFRLTDQRVRIPAGETRVPLPISIMDDDQFEESEQLMITIQEADHLAVPPEAFVLTLVDNEPRPILSAQLSPAVEGQRGELLLTLDRPSSVDAVIALTVSDGLAQAGRDLNLEARQVRLPAGSTQLAVPITYLRDAVYEGPESFTLNLTAISGVEIPTPRTTSEIVDINDPPTLLLTNRALAETQGGEILIDLQVFGAFERTIQLPFALTNGSATGGEDFVAQQGTLTFTPTAPEAIVGLQLMDDRIPEGDETFFLTPARIPELSIPGEQLQLLIIDNEVFTSP